MCQASLPFTISHSLLKLMSTVLVTPSSHFILFCPLLFLPSLFPSIRVFSNESALHIRRPKYWNFSFSISLFNEYSVLNSLGLTCPVFLQSGDSQESPAAPQFKSTNSSPSPSLWKLSLLYSPTLVSIHDFWKNHRQIFFSKAMSLLFNTLSRFLIAFLPKSKCLYLPISPDKFL